MNTNEENCFETIKKCTRKQNITMTLSKIEMFPHINVKKYIEI